MLYFNRKEDQIWHHTLRALAARFGVDAIVQQSATCIDPKRQWRNAANIRYNAGIRTVAAPGHVAGSAARRPALDSQATSVSDTRRKAIVPDPVRRLPTNPGRRCSRPAAFASSAEDV